MFLLSQHLDQLENYCFELLKNGPLPQHIGIIPDGNRRYAKKHKITVLESHSKGFDNMFIWANKCFSLGIPEVSAHFMSLNNFLRGEKAKNDLFEAIFLFLERIFQNGDLMKRQIRVRIYGEWQTMPEKLVRISKKISTVTRDNEKFSFNIACPYEGRYDATSAINDILDGVNNNLINVDDIDQSLIQNCLYTKRSRNMDLLVRAGFVYWFSDFVMWLNDATIVHYFKDIFPEAKLSELLWALLKYQKTYMELDGFKTTRVIKSFNKRTEQFLAQLPDTYERY